MNYYYCDRCAVEMVCSMLSWFNMEQICPGCQGIEGAHPDFTKAVEVENAEVAKGNTNYEGIGLPADLREDAEIRKERRRVG